MATARKKAKGPPAKVSSSDVPADLLKTYFQDMLLIRRFEEKAGQMYGMGLIGGFCHLYIGQEAVVTGLQHALIPGDSVITGYRCHAHMLAAGADPKNIMAELMGRANGVSQGKGGSMHMYAPDSGFFGGNGIVGAQVPLGAGLGFAHRYRESENISVTYFGDGAANQGQVFETFNMAALWSLPVIFVIENNQYAMGTSLARSTAVRDLCQRGQAFGIQGHQVDGMDVISVRAAADEAAGQCRRGEGPVLLEMMTYRYRGHSMSDPAKYRSREEVSKMRKERDPIEQIRALIIDGGHAKEEELKDVDKLVKGVVNEAAEFAQNCPEPELSKLHEDIYANV